MTEIMPRHSVLQSSDPILVNSHRDRDIDFLCNLLQEPYSRPSTAVHALQLLCTRRLIRFKLFYISPAMAKPQYLTGDSKAISAFIDKFDVRPLTLLQTFACNLTNTDLSLRL